MGKKSYALEDVVAQAKKKGVRFVSLFDLEGSQRETASKEIWGHWIAPLAGHSPKELIFNMSRQKAKVILFESSFGPSVLTGRAIDTKMAAAMRLCKDPTFIGLADCAKVLDPQRVPDKKIRAAGLWALDSFNTMVNDIRPEIIPLVSDVLRNQKEHIKLRMMAVETLSRFKNKEAVDALGQVLTDPSQKSHALLLEILNGLSRIAEDAKAVTVKTYNEKDRIIPLIGTYIGAATNPVKQKDTAVRQRAIDILAYLKNDIGLPYLIRSADPEKERSADVRANAVFWLSRSRFKDPGTAKILIKLLDPDIEKNAKIRQDAAWALGQIKDRSAVIPLIKASNPKFEKSPNVRSKAIYALGQIRDKSALETIAQALDPKQESSWQVRQEAANALGHWGGNKAAGHLAQALKKERNWKVFMALTEGLVQIDTPESVLPLIELMRSARIVEHHVIARLGEVSNPKTLDFMKSFLDPQKEANPRIRANIAEVLRRIRKK